MLNELLWGMIVFWLKTLLELYRKNIKNIGIKTLFFINKKNILIGFKLKLFKIHLLLIIKEFLMSVVYLKSIRY